MRPEALHILGTRPGSPGRRLLSLDRGPEWMSDPDRGCSPENGGDWLFVSDDRSDKNRAQAICRTKCPFLTECDQYATDQHESFGVWGGKVRTYNGLRSERTAVPA